MVVQKILVSFRRFALNFKDAEKDANTFFHFNPRFDEGCIVRNSRLNESWGDEERDGDNPFVPGEPFLLSITANVDGYAVSLSIYLNESQH